MVLFTFLVFSLVFNTVISCKGLEGTGTVIVTEAQEPYYFLDLQVSNVMGLRGETHDITVYTNYTGYNLRIIDSLDITIYNQNHLANTTQPFTIPLNAEYGTYTIEARVPEQLTTTWFTVLDVTGWSLASFPFIREHKGLTYTFYRNWTIKANDFTLNLGKLGDLVDSFDLDVTALTNSMNFLVRLQKGSVFALDMSFSFMHRGLKIAFNGTLDQARDFTFNFPSNYVQRLKTLSRNHIVFDYSDIKGAFTYDNVNKELTLHFPQSFDTKQFDPYLFEDGFESGDFTAWTGTGGTPTISEDPVHHGTYSMYCDANVDRVYQTLDPIQTTSYARFYFNLELVPTTGYLRVFGLYNSTTIIVFLTITPTQLTMRSFYPSAVTTSYTISGGWSNETWYCAEIKFVKASGTDGEYRAYLDGTERLTRASIDTSGAPNPASYNFGAVIMSGELIPVYHDCIVIDSSYIGIEGGTAHVADITQSISSSWDVSIGWLSTVGLTQALASTWDASVSWLSTVGLTQAIGSSWIVATGWLLGVGLSQAVATTFDVSILKGFAVGVSQVIGSSWTVTVGWLSGVGLTQAIFSIWTVTAERAIIGGGVGSIAFILAIVALALVVAVMVGKS